MSILTCRSHAGRSIRTDCLRRVGLNAVFGLVALGFPQGAGAQRATQASAIADLSIEELSQIEITTASRHPERLAGVAAAVRVLTGEEIARSGATSIPEALRLVPGLNVAQINGTAWGIGARGFQQQYSSKLLVMRDGRSVYTPIFGGVTWDTQDYLLDDIDRIEVVLGPGGSVWGANAVNGVINIIGKSSRDTVGTFAYGGLGNEKTVMAGGRVGVQLDDNLWGRFYAKYAETDDTELAEGSSGNDGMKFAQTGFRLDGELHGRSSWSLQGDAYSGREESVIDFPSLVSPPTYVDRRDQTVKVSGTNLMGTWRTEMGPDATMRLQAYYDIVQRDAALVWSAVDTLDLEWHQTYAGWERHQIDFGAGYRSVRDRTRDRFVLFRPAERDSPLYNAFLQDRFEVVPDRLLFTIGVKLEHNDFTGLEPQPTVRARWNLSEHHTLWAAYSHAIRTPTRVETAGELDARVFPPGTLHPTLPAVFHIQGDPELDSETLDAWEAGWRFNPHEMLGVEASVFHFGYDRLILVSTTPPVPKPPPDPAVVVVAPWSNGLSGHSEGFELLASWQVSEAWRLRASYSFVHMDLVADGADPLDFEGAADATAAHTLIVQSGWAFAEDWRLDATWRHVDELPTYGIASYSELDVRLAWDVRPDLELVIVGQNLLHDRHAEYQPGVVGERAYIQRGLYAKVNWRY